jgi:hypothetical protein
MEAQKHHQLRPVLGLVCALQIWMVTSVTSRAAAEAACSSPQVHWSSNLHLRWQHALLAACDELGSSQSLDPDIRIVASARGQELQLAATSTDGRTALRVVPSPDELLMTMQALALVPPATGSAAGERLAPTRRSQQSSAAPLPAAHAERYRHMPVELGIVLMGRVAFAPEYISPALALHAGLQLDSLTVGIDVRWNPFQTPFGRPSQPGLEVESLGAGLFVTRRLLDAESFGLDLGARAFLAADTRALEVNEAATEHTIIDGRVGLLARWSLGGPTARWALELDAELSPARLRAHEEFPAFSVGLGGGGVWEVK